jgi:hypothetical protein
MGPWSWPTTRQPTRGPAVLFALHKEGDLEVPAPKGLVENAPCKARGKVPFEASLAVAPAEAGPNTSIRLVWLSLCYPWRMTCDFQARSAASP